MSRATKAAPVSPMSKLRSDSLTEGWIAARLQLPELFMGHTSTEIRRDRLKVVLIERKLTDQVAGKLDGKPSTWRDLFKLLYGEDLA